jgi:hypothetical protein
MAQQTATEWLIEQVKSKEWQDMFIWHKEEVFNQALQMENNHIVEGNEMIELTEQDIINAFNDGRTWNMSWNGKSYFEELFKNPNTLGR